MSHHVTTEAERTGGSTRNDSDEGGDGKVASRKANAKRGKGESPDKGKGEKIKTVDGVCAATVGTSRNLAYE